MDTPASRHPVVVGVDGSACGDLARDWAAQQASLEQRPLVLVHAVLPPSAGAGSYLESTCIGSVDMLDQLRRDAEELLSRKAREVRETHDLIDVRQVVRLTDAREALLESAHGASMVVVGTRGLGPIRQLLLGSVSLAMTKHSSSPVVVVRPGPSGAHEAGVLTGVTGDDRDHRVLDFAFRVAHARAVPVTVVHAFWDAAGDDDETRELPTDEPGYEEQRALLADAVRGPAQLHPSVPVHHLLSRGFADVELIAASRRAELLVLGHRRKPFLREFIYGSVAPRVVEHARCSVAVVPVGAEAGE